MADPLSRRTVLLSGLAAGGALLAAEPARAAAATDFDTVRLQWFDTLIGSYDLADPVVAAYVTDTAATAQALWSSLNTASGRTYLWSDLDSGTVSAVQRNNAGRLRTLALAYRSRGSALAGNPDLKNDLASALDWFLAQKYGPSVHSYDNWWDWQIGIPLALNDVCVALHDQIGAARVATAMAAIAHYAPDPTVTGGAVSTGANRNWACAIAIVRGALSGDAATIAGAKNAIADVFTYATGGDGFYPDGGFIQHAYFPYTGGYGISLLQYLTYAMLATRGTPWAFTAPRISEIYDWTQRNYRPWIYGGAMMDMVRGRGLSRFYETDHRQGRLTVATLLQLAEVLPAARAGTVRAQCKGWMAADGFFAYDSAPIEQVRLASIVLGRAVLADPSVAAVGESTETVVATSVARAVHRRPGFAYAVAMDSSTIKPYESANNENLKGWYTSEGAVYVYLPAQPGHWTNQYWPTADKYRVPGTTVDTRTLALGAGRGSTNTWTGGALLDGNAALGMGLSFAVQTLTAKKSWLCAGDVIVCLGAGITSTDGNTVETIVEQRNIGPDGATVPIVDGAAALSPPSGTPTTLNPRWIWIPKAGGYVFPAGTALKATRADRTGRWTDLDHRGVYDDATSYTRRFITLWYDHGVSPSGASYAYLQLPGATQAATAAAAGSTDLAVVANSTAVQAVRRASDGLTLANFWSGAAPKTAGITVDRPVSVVLSRSGGELAVAVSDPTRRLGGPVTVTIDGAATGTISADPGIEVLATSPAVRLSIDLDGTAGRSQVARFSL
ncbi:polysaccharide lyase 8 family protein [Actinoplanes sp. L3-i22]|uniref:polysaccharide lyase 8 family protein n=1 Tax=Actinoplanes sp. L3-i22 TaxID=2836373 RepID=UPI001C774234|nr:polysaccharide lyase 8 family protein [Actinoplanes sp. L3-i22]BCY05980.1 lyase [Actinoplanes sp. L3-i22]